MSVEQKKTIPKLSGTSEELREALKGNKVEIGLDIDGRDPKQREFLKDILNKPNQNQEQTPEEKDEIISDLTNKLGIIAEKKLDEKRKGVVEKINRYISDPQKRAEMIEKLNGQKPEGVMAMESTMNLLEEQLSKNNNQRFESPAGSAPMNSQQLGSSIETDDIYRKKFGSYDDMIRALRNESKSEDKQKAQHANLVLNALLNKYAVAQKQIHEENRYCEDDAIPKTDKVPTVDFSQANESFSELERFGIHKSPLNYSRNFRKIVAQKGKESE
jgi:uncharacterized protein (DUF2267 family)